MRSFRVDVGCVVKAYGRWLKPMRPRATVSAALTVLSGKTKTGKYLLRSHRRLSRVLLARRAFVTRARPKSLLAPMEESWRFQPGQR